MKTIHFNSNVSWKYERDVFLIVAEEMKRTRKRSLHLKFQEEQYVKSNKFHRQETN